MNKTKLKSSVFRAAAKNMQLGPCANNKYKYRYSCDALVDMAYDALLFQGIPTLNSFWLYEVYFKLYTTFYSKLYKKKANEIWLEDAYTGKITKNTQLIRTILLLLAAEYLDTDGDKV